MPVEQRGPGGLGIFLVRQMMDSIDYARRDGRNILTVTASRRDGDE
jgi:anti-sigma regulatory factor (Ser/Thr protein kinase)